MILTRVIITLLEIKYLNDVHKLSNSIITSNGLNEINQICCTVNESKVNHNEIIKQEIEKALMVTCGI